MFKDIYLMWTERHLTQAKAAEMLGVYNRTLRRWVYCHVRMMRQVGALKPCRTAVCCQPRIVRHRWTK